MVHKYNLNSWIVSILILIFFFRESIGKVFLSVQYMDEILTLIVMILLLFKIKEIYVDKEFSSYWIGSYLPIFIILLLGIFSNYFSDLEVPFWFSLVDALGLIKLPLVFSFFIFFITDKTKKEIKNLLLPIFVIYLLIIFCSLIMFKFNLFPQMQYDNRLGINTFKFIYNNPGTLNEKLIIISLVLHIIKNKITRTLLYVIEIIIMFSTMRMNIILTIIIAFMMFVFYQNRDIKKIRIKNIVIVFFTAIIIGRKQIAYYFLGNYSTPRKRLLFDGIYTMNSYFPLGSGFATFGSEQSFQYYSHLYYKYGYNYIWGLSPDTGYYINDNFWPMLAAQIGFLGPLLYSCFLYTQFSLLIKAKVNKKVKILMLSSFLYLIISSIGAAILTSVESLIIAILLGINLPTEKSKAL